MTLTGTLTVLALEADWAAQSQTNDAFASVFFGGGTKSLSPEHIGRLLDKLPITTNAEITLEVNPGTQGTWIFRLLHSRN